MKHLWVRYGDNAEYENITIDCIIDTLKELKIKKVVRSFQYGITDNNQFQGHNYISLFYADKTGINNVEEIPDNELREINRSIAYSYNPF